MEVSGQLNAPPALLPGKEPLVSIGYEARCSPEPLGKRKIPSPSVYGYKLI